MYRNNLELLKVLHIVKGIISIITSLFLIGALFVVRNMADDAVQKNGQQLPDFNITFFVTSIIIFPVVLFFILGIMNFIAARKINDITGHTFILITSIFNCVSGVLGLVLGIFTLIEIHKKDVEELFLNKML